MTKMHNTMDKCPIKPSSSSDEKAHVQRNEQGFEKESAIIKLVSMLIFIFVIIAVFWFTQKRLTDNITHCTLISIMAAVVLTYFQSKFIADALTHSNSRKTTEHEALENQAQHKRLEEKVQKLTSQLSAAKSRLQVEIAEQPMDQRQLQVRLKHLHCLYALSKIVNRQGVSLEHIFRETVGFVQAVYRYPDNTCVRLTFNGVSYKTDNFKKSEFSQQVHIKAHEENVGIIEVYYRGKEIDEGEESFLKEEHDFLGAVAEWMGSIIERKKAEEKLLLFKNLTARSNDCIFAIEPKWGRFIDFNNRACDSLGYTRKELLEVMSVKDIEESVSDDQLWQRQIEELRNEHDVIKETRYKRKDGTTFEVETSLKLITEEKQEYIIAIARDITERKRAQAKLKAAQEKLLETARQVGMAEVATGVLHNVGNVLNSVGVTADSLQKKISKSKISYLSDVIDLLHEHSDDMAAFLTKEQRGRKIHAFLTNLADDLVEEQKRSLELIEELTRHVQHVADIIQLQQSYSRTKGLVEPTSLVELIDDAIKINAESIARNNVKVERKYAQLPVVLLDRHKVLQILTNLISNAIYAVSRNQKEDKIISIRAEESEGDYLNIEVSDNGIGISEEDIRRIFVHGFTTKEKGHGFGLHSAALSANELKGSIKAHSKGTGRGATFCVKLPLKRKATTI